MDLSVVSSLRPGNPSKKKPLSGLRAAAKWVGRN
jgi:hypothetical protein